MRLNIILLLILPLVISAEDDVEEEQMSSYEDERDRIAIARQATAHVPKMKGASHIVDHFAQTGEMLRPHLAHQYNSRPDVADLQKSAPPRVSFKLRNFGLAEEVTHLVNLTFNVGGKPRGTVLIGLFGKLAPVLVANFRKLVDSGDGPSLIGSRCVRYAPDYILQCGDLGPHANGSPDHLEDRTFRPDDGVAPENWDDYMEFASLMRSEASFALRELPLWEHTAGLINVHESQEWTRLRTTKHVVGSVSMVLRDGNAGSHFFMSATPTNYDFDGVHAPIGVVLSGFTSTLQTILLQQVPIDIATLAPRKGSEVTISAGSVRRFAGQSFTLYYEQRFSGAREEIERVLRESEDPTESLTSKSVRVPRRPSIAHEFSPGALRGWLLPIPAMARGRIFEAPLSAEAIRQNKIIAQRKLLEKFNEDVMRYGRRGARALGSTKSHRRPQRRGR